MTADIVFKVTIVILSLSCKSYEVVVVAKYLVGYGGIERLTHCSEFKSLSTAPNRHIVGYIVLCNAFLQNWWLFFSYSMKLARLKLC